MLVSWFLSIWISNTAITAMMLPIILSLVKNLVKMDTDFHPKNEREDLPAPANVYSSKKFIFYYLPLLIKIVYSLFIDNKKEVDSKVTIGVFAQK